MFDYYNYQQQRRIQQESSELLPEWLRIPYSTFLKDFIYESQPKFWDADIETSSFTIEDWLFIRRHMPLLDTPLDDLQKDVFDAIKEDLINIMSNIGLAVLIIWLLRKKNKDVKIDGDSNIIGDNNTIKFSKSINNITVLIGAPPAEQEAIPILAIYQPESSVRFFPLSSDYKNLDASSLQNAIRALSKDNRIERIKAISAIKDSGNPEYINQIVPRILDNDPVVQIIAADTAGEHQISEATPVLMEALSQKEVPLYVKEALAFSLIEIKGKEAILDLMNLYYKAPPSYLNFPIMLACLKNDSYYDVIIKQITDGSRESKISAIHLIKEIFTEQEFNPSV